MPKIIKYGFIIDNGKIYDSKVYDLVVERSFEDGECSHDYKIKYTRLFKFEPLLFLFSEGLVFEILKINDKLITNRNTSENLVEDNYTAIYSASTIMAYPSTSLTKRKLSLYRRIKQIEKKYKVNCH